MNKTVALDDIVDNPFQPRTTLDPEITSLANEMQAGGRIAITTVRLKPDTTSVKAGQ